jgi:surfeit locus 1 family protein
LTDLPELEYRRIRVRGHYENEKSIYIGPKVYEGAHGYHVVTPLVRSGDEAPILVNRGFVSDGHLNNLNESSSPEITVLALLRRAPSKYWLTPNNKPDENKWYWLDVKTVMGYSGSDPDTERFCGVYLEEVFQGDPGDVKSKMAQGMPIGRSPTVDFRNTHATYAFIW